MKIKTLVLLTLSILLFSWSTFAAVDIKKEEITVNQNQEKKTLNNLSFHKISRFNFSKKRKFRLRDFFKWKKKKGRVSQKPDSLKEVPLSANLSAMFASAGSVIILFLWVLGARYSFYIPFLIFPLLVFGFVAAIILGFIGLRKIKSDQDKYGGKRLAWFGLTISFIWVWIFCLLLFSFL